MPVWKNQKMIDNSKSVWMNVKESPDMLIHAEQIKQITKLEM